MGGREEGMGEGGGSASERSHVREWVLATVPVGLPGWRDSLLISPLGPPTSVCGCSGKPVPPVHSVSLWLSFSVIEILTISPSGIEQVDGGSSLPSNGPNETALVLSLS